MCPKPMANSYTKRSLTKANGIAKTKDQDGKLEPSCALYSNRWFTVPKKNVALWFIQDMQPVNKVTIRNVGTGPIVDEFAEAFAGKSIYSMGDLMISSSSIYKAGT